MDLEKMSKKQLIKEIKKHCMLCIKTFTVEFKIYKRKNVKKIKDITFNKGEYYYTDHDEGGSYIFSDDGECFEFFEIPIENFETVSEKELS